MNSDLYRLFYIGKKSIYETLRKAKHLKIVFVKEKALKRFGQGTLIYYYDDTKISLKFPWVVMKNEVYRKMEKFSQCSFLRMRGVGLPPMNSLKMT